MPNTKSSFRDRPRIAHITNHGYAGVDVPYGGAPDTGGQNVYVNFIVEAMVELGYHVTVFTRGGFPFFESEKIREGIEPYGEHARYVYVPGAGDEFIRKEDIAISLDEEVDWVEEFIAREAGELGCRPWQVYELVDTHYWDAGVMGMLLTERWRSLKARELVRDLIAGGIPEGDLAKFDGLDTRSAVGQTPEFFAGKALFDATNQLEPNSARVTAALESWCRRHAPDRTREIADGGVREFTQASRGSSPALVTLAAADVIGRTIFQVAGVELEKELCDVEKHVFTPHSLGVLKGENYRDRPLEVQRNLKFCERRNHEVAVCASAHAFAATSTEIAERLRTHLRVPTDRMFYFPAGIDRRLYRTYSDDELVPLYEFLEKSTGLGRDRLERATIVFETSRMDRTKRKDLLLESFAVAAKDAPDALCLIGGGPSNEIFAALKELKASDPVLSERAFLLGFLPDELMYPLFSRADIFVTGSEMEGFGLSAAQAAAVGRALVTSDLVPFALQYVPDDAFVVPAGDVQGFADAIGHLLRDREDRLRRGKRLAEKTASLDWIEQTRAFLDHLRLGGLDITRP